MSDDLSKKVDKLTRENTDLKKMLTKIMNYDHAWKSFAQHWLGINEKIKENEILDQQLAEQTKANEHLMVANAASLKENAALVKQIELQQIMVNTALKVQTIGMQLEKDNDALKKQNEILSKANKVLSEENVSQAKEIARLEVLRVAANKTIATYEECLTIDHL
jgi:hypothetical protein